VAGNDVRFEIEAAGNPSYQWVRDGTDIPAATGNSFLLQDVTPNDGGTFLVRLLNESRLIESATATLTVYPDAVPLVTGVNASPTTFSFNLQGRVGLEYQIEKSTDLQNWISVETITAPALFSDEVNGDRGFYRISPVAQ
jgi:hypothetical protein